VRVPFEERRLARPRGLRVESGHFRGAPSRLQAAPEEADRGLFQGDSNLPLGDAHRLLRPQVARHPGPDARLRQCPVRC